MSAGARQVLFLAVAAAFLAQPVLADDAKHRSSGSSSGSSSAGSRHHSGSSGSRSSGSAVSRSGSSSSSRDSSPYSHGSAVSRGTPLTGAQARHPRAGTGTGWRYPYGGYYGGHGGYYGGYYPYYGYGYGGYPYYGYGYGYGYGYPYWSFGFGYYPYGGLYLDSSWWGAAPYVGYGAYARSSADTGSVRVLVDQPKARVYVDGYLAGIVDDFDGMFQRLYVAPGEHDITLKLEGYKTHNFAVHVPYESTLKLRWEMEPGEGHDGSGDPTLAPPRRAARGARDDAYGEDRDRDPYRERDEAPEVERDAERAPVSVREAPVGLGSVRFEVRPADASIYVDGAFRGTGRDLRSLELKAGSHRVEIVKPGYRTYERDVMVDAAGFVDLSVELEK